MIGTLRISEREFEKFSDLVYRRAGINLHQGKKQLVQARLGKIIRHHGLSSFRDYYEEVLTDDSGDKLCELLDRISTNHTYFFREHNHLHQLTNTILPEIVSLEGVRKSNELRLWSAGCSTGEEPYSIAIHLLEYGRLPAEMRVRILATDLSKSVIAIADRGIYRDEKLTNVPPHLRRKYFQKGRGSWTGYYRVDKTIRSLITFRKFNLIETFPFRGQFEVIFCRNVMIYFDKQVQQEVVNKFFQVVKPGGYFVVGHSESLSGIQHHFKYIAPTIYKRPL